MRKAAAGLHQTAFADTKAGSSFRNAPRTFRIDPAVFTKGFSAFRKDSGAIGKAAFAFRNDPRAFRKAAFAFPKDSGAFRNVFFAFRQAFFAFRKAPESFRRAESAKWFGRPGPRRMLAPRHRDAVRGVRGDHMRGGLKAVSRRRDDALARLKWDRLEHVLADHYRDCGYQVEHCGTGASGSRFDGGIDLKLRRAGEYILVQCKHWNACKVTHNPVHELFGVMTGEGATGAILVTSGEFSKAAIDAAARLHAVQLIDGDELRAMIGVLPEEPADPSARTSGQGRAETLVASAAERLVAAAEDRIRNGGGFRRQARDRAAQELIRIALKFAFVIATLWFVGGQLQGIVKSVAPVRAASAFAAPTQGGRQQTVPAMGRPHSASTPLSPSIRPSPARPAPTAVVNDLDEAQLREWRRKNAESMKALESTPELPLVLPAGKSRTGSGSLVG